MEKLTPKQKAFADNYIANGGNATQAAIEAGYSKKMARSIGPENTKKPNVAAYIAVRQKQIEDDRICSIAEIQQFRTRVLRGEEKDQFELDVAMTDRLKAATDLEKALRIKEEVEEQQRRAEAARNAGTYHIDLDMVGDSFHALIRDIRSHKHGEYVLKGGRGSLKSSTVSFISPELIINNPDMHMLILRKVGNTIRDSVFAQTKWAIQKQGLEDDFAYKTTPFEITYKPTGQKIYFRGADDPLKIKSIKPEFGYIGIIWFEELDQFAGPEEVRNIQQSALRGGDATYKFKSFNPPQSSNNWANEYVRESEDEDGVLIHKSTYLDVPPEWLGTTFIEDAARLKRVNEKAYEHEYLGEANGTGGQVFEYLELREIPDEEIAKMDTIYQGLDWGFYPDPFAFIRAYYNPKEEKIYLIDELRTNRMSNATTAEWIKEKGYDDYIIIADSAEPKSIKDYKDSGLTVRTAIKGPGSVEHGMKWLQVRTIVIDKRRTPEACKEIVKYEFARDKDGNFISGYPDKDNHFIDALRYAFEPVSRRRGSSA